MCWRRRLPPGTAKRAFTEPRTFSVQRTPCRKAGGSDFILPVRVTGVHLREELLLDVQRLLWVASVHRDPRRSAIRCREDRAVLVQAPAGRGIDERIGPDIRIVRSRAQRPGAATVGGAV